MEGAPEGLAAPAPHLTSIVLLLYISNLLHTKAKHMFSVWKTADSCNL